MDTPPLDDAASAHSGAADGSGRAARAPGALHMITVTQFDLVLKVAPRGGGGAAALSVWAPVVPMGFVALGHVATVGGARPRFALAVKRAAIPGSSLVAPQGFNKAWEGDGGAVWVPVAPAGYVAMGCVASVAGAAGGAARPTGFELPRTGDAWCVRSDYAGACAMRPGPLCVLGAAEVWQPDNGLGTFTLDKGGAYALQSHIALTIPKGKLPALAEHLDKTALLEGHQAGEDAAAAERRAAAATAVAATALVEAGLTAPGSGAAAGDARKGGAWVEGARGSPDEDDAEAVEDAAALLLETTKRDGAYDDYFQRHRQMLRANWRAYEDGVRGEAALESSPKLLDAVIDAHDARLRAGAPPYDTKLASYHLHPLTARGLAVAPPAGGSLTPGAVTEGPGGKVSGVLGSRVQWNLGGAPQSGGGDSAFGSRRMFSPRGRRSTASGTESPTAAGHAAALAAFASSHERRELKKWCRTAFSQLILSRQRRGRNSGAAPPSVAGAAASVPTGAGAARRGAGAHAGLHGAAGAGAAEPGAAEAALSPVASSARSTPTDTASHAALPAVAITGRHLSPVVSSVAPPVSSSPPPVSLGAGARATEGALGGDAPKWLQGVVESLSVEMRLLRQHNDRLSREVGRMVDMQRAQSRTISRLTKAPRRARGDSTPVADDDGSDPEARSAERLEAQLAVNAVAHAMSSHDEPTVVYHFRSDDLVGDPLHPEVVDFNLYTLMRMLRVPVNMDAPNASTEGLALPCKPKAVAALQRIFRVAIDRGEIVFPEPMVAKMTAAGKSMDDFQVQSVLSVCNAVTDEGIFFNKIRAKRPGAVASLDEEALLTFIESMKGSGCDFCHPTKYTGMESWGRIQSVHCITAANMAKYAGFHGLVLASEHNPHKVTGPMLADMLQVSAEWFRRASLVAAGAVADVLPDRERAGSAGDGTPSLPPAARPSRTGSVGGRKNRWWCPHIMWDILPKGGASQVHTHFQISLCKDRYFAQWEVQRTAARRYAGRTGGRNYWRDLALAHDAAGLAIRRGDAVAFASLTPPVGTEVVLMAETLSDDLAALLYDVLEQSFKRVGMRAFSMGICLPPLSTAGRVKDPLRMPVIVKVVDRGNPDDVRSDMSANEIYGSPIISTDPFILARQLAHGIREAARKPQPIADAGAAAAAAGGAAGGTA